MPQVLGFEHFSILPPAQNPVFHFFSPSRFSGKDNGTILLWLNLLRMMPNFFLDVAGSFFIKTNLYFDWFVVDDLEGALHVGFEIEVTGDLEGFVRDIHHLYSVQHEHADFAAKVAEADEVEGGVEEHDLVGVNLSAVFLPSPAHGLVDHVDGSVVHRCVVDLLDDFSEPFKVFVRFEPDVEGLLHPVHVGQGFGGERGFYFLKKCFKCIIKNRAFKDTYEVAAEVEGHELRQGEGHGEHVFVFVPHGPDALAVHPVGVDGKACFLEGFQVAVDSAGVAVFVAYQVGHGLAVLGGDEGLDYSPLTG
mgnify:CR=1 FL=1